jgi:ABC-type Fe3+/spermidine/putrescine transport system ATPase subunit
MEFMMAESTNIVRVTDVYKTFQLGKVEVQALQGVNLEIARGNYISIMGPSGSGKSTLFNMIGGLDKPSSGYLSMKSILRNWMLMNWPGCAAARSAIFFKPLILFR